MTVEPVNDAASRFYRVLGWMLPGSLGVRWRSEMEELLRWRLDRVGESRVARAGVWVRAVLDLVLQSVLMRFPGRGPREGDSRSHGMRQNELITGQGRGGAMKNDLGYALRSLIAAPLFSLTSVATLALGIGAAVATFSVVHSVLLKPLPYPDSDQLVSVWPEVNYNAAMVSRTAEAMPGLAGVAGMSFWGYVLLDGPAPAEIGGVRVTPGYFELLGSRPSWAARSGPKTLFRTRPVWSSSPTPSGWKHSAATPM